MLVVKNSPANAGDARDAGLILQLRRSPGGGNGNPLQYSCLENPMDRGAWQAMVQGVAKSQTRLKRFRAYAGAKKWHTGMFIFQTPVSQPFMLLKNTQ